MAVGVITVRFGLVRSWSRPSTWPGGFASCRPITIYVCLVWVIGGSDEVMAADPIFNINLLYGLGPTRVMPCQPILIKNLVLMIWCGSDGGGGGHSSPPLLIFLFLIFNFY